MAVPHFTFSNGVKIPAVGLGTSRSGENLEQGLEEAVKCGYRQIDTAFSYGNEEKIGKVLQKLFQQGIVKRSEMFITTKLHLQYYHKEDVEQMLRGQLQSLQLDYVDLYLIHSPWGLKKVEGELFPKENGVALADPVDYLETWKALEDMYQKGLVKSIGLSNFCPSQIKRIYKNATVKPHNLQLLCHGYWPQDELYKLCNELNIVMTAYSPLGSREWYSNPRTSAIFGKGKPEYTLLDDETVMKIASHYGKSPAQILLRWLFQRGIHVIPKSTNKDRLKENLDIFGFTLLDKDMTALSNLPVRDRLFANMDQFFHEHPHFISNESY